MGWGCPENTNANKEAPRGRHLMVKHCALSSGAGAAPRLPGEAAKDSDNGAGVVGAAGPQGPVGSAGAPRVVSGGAPGAHSPGRRRVRGPGRGACAPQTCQHSGVAFGGDRKGQLSANEGRGRGRGDRRSLHGSGLLLGMLAHQNTGARGRKLTGPVDRVWTDTPDPAILLREQVLQKCPCPSRCSSC